MKKAIVAAVLFLGLLAASSSVSALTLADVELLVSLGLLSGDQAEIARQAIQASSASGSAGVSIRPDEFSATECLALTDNMARGVTGSAVTALQRFLKTQGHYVANELSGTYDNATYVAVMDFQVAQGLISSRTVSGAGNVGPLTREKIQEVSCAPAAQTSTVETEVATSTNEQLFERRLRGTGLPKIEVPFNGEYEILFNPRLSTTDPAKGAYEYRFEMGIEPNDDVYHWHITLTCDEGQVTTSRSDLQCGNTIMLRAATDGKKTLRITFTNTTQLAQEIGIVAVARTREAEELGRATFVRDLEQKTVDPVARTASGQPIIIGDVQIPENRMCSTAEQFEYLEYIMTRPASAKGKILTVPPCYPGDVVCTYDFPSSYCEIRGTTVNSVSLCGGTGYFYDGACKPLSTTNR